MVLAGAVIGAVVSIVSALGLRAWAHRRQMLQKVGTPLAEHGRPLPPVGGAALALGCAIGAAVCWGGLGIRQATPWIWLAMAAGLTLIVGLIDDFVRELSAWQKLVGQSLAWLCLARADILTHIVMLPAWANWLVSLVWTLAIINAFNLLDIADGLAVGVGLIATGTFLVVSRFAGQPAVAGLLAVLGGALLGVFIFNFPRATLFLGDSGSMLLGVLLAAFALIIKYAPLGREVALLTPVVVLGFPLYDLAFVTLVRIAQRRAVFKKSPDHFVFRLMHMGRSPVQAVLAMLGMCALFGTTALVVSRAPNLPGAITLSVLGGFFLWWAVRLFRIPMA